MNNVECMLSTREQTRIGYGKQFLKDLFAQAVIQDHDPRNFIGYGCGISLGRALIVAGRRYHRA
jgi:hypothetical protein